jgi:hypothetical protein
VSGHVALTDFSHLILFTLCMVAVHCPDQIALHLHREGKERLRCEIGYSISH